jgi:hypothetical protein
MLTRIDLENLESPNYLVDLLQNEGSLPRPISDFVSRILLVLDCWDHCAFDTFFVNLCDLLKKA